MRSLLLSILFVPSLALAAPSSDGSCGAAPSDRGFWSSLGTTVRRALSGGAPAGDALADVSFADGKSGTLFGTKKVDPVGGPSFFDLVLETSSGKRYKLSGHGNGELATKLCAPFERKFPHTYTTVDSKGFFEDVASIDDVMVARENDDSIKVRAIHCMAEPY